MSCTACSLITTVLGSCTICQLLRPAMLQSHVPVINPMHHSIQCSAGSCCWSSNCIMHYSLSPPGVWWFELACHGSSNCTLHAGCSALHQAIEQAGTYEPGTKQQLQSLAACINANAHATGHKADTNSATGLGMYPVLSMFNHSCNPNLAHSSIGE